MKQLPPSPDLAHLKKQAKQLLGAYRDGDPDALRTFLEFLPSVQHTTPERLATRELYLHDAQSCVAHEYGFHSWAELKTFVDWKAAGVRDRAEAIDRWLRLVYGIGAFDARPKLAIRLLRERPDLIEGDAHLACAIGYEAALRNMLDADASCVNREGGRLKMAPLIAVTFSGLVNDGDFAEPLLRCAKLLLDHGADVNSTWIDPRFPYSPLSALYGAAGRNHHGGMTKLLLDHGANPNDNESLYHSVESSDLTCTRLLLQAGARVDGTNAIGRVLDYDRIEGLGLLLDHGGDPGQRGASEAPLFHAIRRGRSVEHVLLLLEAGADPAARNKEGLTLHQFALFFGLAGIAALFRGDREQGLESPEDRFVAACACCDRAAALDILKEDPGIMQRLSEKQLRQLPNMAANGNLPAVKIMVELGWPTAATGGDWGASALNLAVYRGQVEMVGFLLRHGASWEEKHRFGDNVMGTLAYASKAVNIETESGDWLACAKALIAHGMPLPPERYEFSEEVTEYFESLCEGNDPQGLFR